MTQKMKIAAVCTALLCAQVGAEAALNTANIERLTGLKGTLNEKESVFKVSYPRTDTGLR